MRPSRTPGSCRRRPWATLAFSRRDCSIVSELAVMTLEETLVAEGKSRRVKRFRIFPVPANLVLFEAGVARAENVLNQYDTPNRRGQGKNVNATVAARKMR